LLGHLTKRGKVSLQTSSIDRSFSLTKECFTREQRTKKQTKLCLASMSLLKTGRVDLLCLTRSESLSTSLAAPPNTSVGFTSLLKTISSSKSCRKSGSHLPVQDITAIFLAVTLSRRCAHHSQLSTRCISRALAKEDILSRSRISKIL
jgi:hypothetical protein